MKPTPHPSALNLKSCAPNARRQTVNMNPQHQTRTPRCKISNCLFKRNDVGITVDDYAHMTVENCTMLSAHYGFVDVVEWGIPMPGCNPPGEAAKSSLVLPSAYPDIRSSLMPWNSTLEHKPLTIPKHRPRSYR